MVSYLHKMFRMKIASLKIGVFVCFVAAQLGAIAQNPTLGLLHHDAAATDGYTLFSPENNNNVYLVDNCGEKIHEWEFSERPGVTCYLLENGTLLRAGKDSLEIRDWDNTLLWSYGTAINGISQHHDIEPLPNGNILLVATQLLTAAEIEAEGRDPNLITANFKVDMVLELEPVGTNSANLVWEWRFIDHVVQEFDSTKLNYGVVQDHPELLDLNFDHGSNFDWTHINAVDYNATLDQLIISSKNMHEIYIIDHSTTAAEVGGHTGGNSGRGGDFLWRWGNPSVYHAGTAQDQLLFDQHDPKWVEPGFPDDGKISVFNNGGDGVTNNSSIHLIEPDLNAGVYGMAAGKFLPAAYDWTWSDDILGVPVYSNKKCGTHQLESGNFLITQTYVGQVSEITKAGEHLWTYRNPSGSLLYNQYAVIPANSNSIFRAEKYAPTYPGFAGQDLTPQGILEDQNAFTDTCRLFSAIEEDALSYISLTNPVENGVLVFGNAVNLDLLSIVDLNGKLVLSKTAFTGTELPVDLPAGMYFLRLSNGKAVRTTKIVVL
jgi:hypothetical protein